jgi:surface antigen
VLTRRLSLPATLLALAALFAGLLVGAPRAEATSTLLCKGFAACAKAGYSNFGYSAVYKQMWWRMYAGHNCTNYVAYRMVKSGMSATRPWSGSGDARNWGVVFASKTNQTPKVGSIAWWSSNHVAYVQQVIDANTIVVSEDHWGGDFDWRKIVRAGGGWPTGFIHLRDERLTATAAPRITGAPKVDAPLAATPGSWNLPGATYSYQWRANGVAITGATRSTYTPTAAQVGATFTVRVRATRYGYRAGASVSTASAAAAPGTMTATAAPTVTGVPKVGGVLTVTGGSFTPAASSSSIAWLADGVPIAGATTATLKLGAAHLDRRITAVVTGRRAGYTNAVSASAPTAPIGPEKLTMTSEPTLTDAPHVGRPLTVTPGVVGPAGVTTKYRWFRDGTRIRGAKAQTYTPTTKDLGSRLSVRVIYAKPGYTSIGRMLQLSAPVRTYPRIRARSLTHRTVTVTLSAEGVRYTRGKVTLVNARGERRTRVLERGATTFRASWIRAGARTFTVIYQGSRLVEGKTTVRRITVK